MQPSAASMRDAILAGSERLLLTVWIGVVWGVGYVAVPVLFATLEERTLAGVLAGRMFHLVSYLGLAAGSLLATMRLLRLGTWRDWRLAVIAAMLLSVLLGEFVLQPQMAALKADGPVLEGTERAASFARLHGAASLLYLFTSLGGAVLVGAGLPAKGGADTRG